MNWRVRLSLNLSQTVAASEDISVPVVETGAQLEPKQELLVVIHF